MKNNITEIRVCRNAESRIPPSALSRVDNVT